MVQHFLQTLHGFKLGVRGSEQYGVGFRLWGSVCMGSGLTARRPLRRSAVQYITRELVHSPNVGWKSMEDAEEQWSL